MSIGLLALLDDAAALIKASAASLDDIASQVAKTSGKVSGIVIDDAAVTPKYVVGLDPKRELAIIYQIGRKSLINKLLILGPAALLLGYFAPWLIQPLLMIGGAYLCFEGYEKLHSIFKKPDKGNEEEATPITPEELEKIRITSAVNTDLILSAEIIAITYASVAESDLMTQAIVMFSIGIIITLAVYGFVALVVKADDIGLSLAKSPRPSIRKTGISIVKMMPGLLKVISYIGTVAMLLVGSEIIAHGIPPIHHLLEGISGFLSFLPGFFSWLARSVILVSGGAFLGFVLEFAYHSYKSRKAGTSKSQAD